MAVVVTDLGTASGTIGGTISITGVNVPAGSLIYVFAFEKNITGDLGFAFDSSQTYNILSATSPDSNVLEGTATVFYIANCLALVGDTITYFKGTPGIYASMAVLYVTGVQQQPDPVVAAGTATGTGSSPSVTLGPFLSSGDLIICNLAWSAGAGDTFTQDSTHAAFATPPDTLIASGSSAGIAGGFVVYMNTAALTYAPALNNARPWAVLMQGFRPGVDSPGHDAVDFYSVGSA
jgi:hypothetical protein